MKKLNIALVLLLCCGALAKGQSWKLVTNLPAEPFLELYSNGDKLYAASANRVYHSIDAGLTWAASAPVQNEEDEITDLLVTDRVIYAATLIHGCYISTDHGESWKQHNTGLNGLGAHNLSGLGIRGDKIYVSTIGAGVFEKPLSPAFATWQAFNNNIPWGSIQSLHVDGDQLLAGAGANATLSRNTIGNAQWSETAFDQFNGEINLFLDAMRDGAVLLGAGTQGLYRSTDGGSKWVHFNPRVGLIERARFSKWQEQALVLLTKPSGSFLRSSKNQGESWEAFQPALPIKNLGFDLLEYQGKLFYAASDGLWVLSTTVSTRNPGIEGFELGQNYPNPSAEPYTQVPFRLGRAGHVLIKVFDLLGRAISSTDLGKLPAGKHSTAIDISTLSKGGYLYALVVDGKMLSKMMIVE